MTSNLKKPPRPKSYAPGFGVINVSAHAGEQQACPGCSADHPPMGGCSACLSVSVAVILYDAKRDRHAMPLCFECVKVVMAWHKEIAAEKAKQRENAVAKRTKQSRPVAKAKRGNVA